jgi:hypothetical protein
MMQSCEMLKTGRDAFHVIVAAARSACFLVLVAVSLMALALHIWALDRFGVGPESRANFFRIDWENSLSELIEYAMLLASACILTITALRRRSGVLLHPAFLCAYLLCDNAFAIHESAGSILYPDNVHTGETIFAALVSVAVAGSGWWVFRKADSFDQQALIGIALVLTAFAFFAVGVDAIHSIVASYRPRYELLFGGIEDFGEMLAIALLLAMSVRLLKLSSPVKA